MPDSPNDGSWFIARGGESQGPYSWPQLRSAAQQGLLRPRDWVWKKGMRKWIRAEEQGGLLARPPAPPTTRTSPLARIRPQPPSDVSGPLLPVPAGSAEPAVAEWPAGEDDWRESSIRPTTDRPDRSTGDEEGPAINAAELIEGTIDTPEGATTFARPPNARRSPPPPPSAADPDDGSEPVQWGRAPDASAPEDDRKPWLPEPTTFARPSSLGETTRQFLAAAGVSAKVRLRRRRRAALLAVLSIAGVLGAAYYLVGAKADREPTSPAPKTEVAAVAPAGEDRLQRSEACRLTGDCPQRKRVRAPTTDYARDRSDRVLSSRGGDDRPEALRIAPLETGGVKPLQLEQAKGPVAPEVRDDEDGSSLSAAQTALVKKKVTSGLKRCKAVFASTDVVVRLKTDKRGKVRSVDVRKGPVRVRRCLSRRARYWRFGSKLGSRQVELKVPAKKGVVRVSSWES